MQARGVAQELSADYADSSKAYRTAFENLRNLWIVSILRRHGPDSECLSYSYLISKSNGIRNIASPFSLSRNIA